MKPLTSADRRTALNTTSANLVWMHLGSNLARARTTLLDGELQAAVIASAGYGPSGAMSNEISDPTGEAAMRGASTELRANAIVSMWLIDLTECYRTLRWLRVAACEALSADMPPHRPATVVRALRDLRALTIVPIDLANRAAGVLEGEDLAEFDAAVHTAHNLATRVRFGAPRIGDARSVPGVSNVLESARKVTEAAPPKPKQKPLVGCVSCRRDNGHFTPIDVKNHSARDMCRVCGDYFSGEGQLLPLGAVQYMHRTGKQLTWKIIEQAKRGAVAS